MKGKKWLVLPVSLAIVLLANSVGGTMASFVDLESSGSNTFEAWTSRQWTQTTESDFNAGVLNNVDTSSSPGDVQLATISPSPPTLVGSWGGETDFDTNGFNYTPGAGSNRVALIMITAESNSIPVANINQVTLGGQVLTAIENGDGLVVGSAGSWHDLIWFGYLDETGIGNMSGNALSITWDTAPTNSPPIMVQAATYQNVDQTTPIADSASNTNTAAGSIQAGSVSVGSDDRLVYVTVCGQPSDHTAPGGYTEQIEQDGPPFSHSNAAVQRDTTTASTENPTATWSGTNRLAIISVVLNGVGGAPSDWYNPGWLYRKSHIINSATGAGTNYQVKVKVYYGSGTDSGENVYLGSKCRTDFGDIRFTDDDQTTLLDYWMQEKVDGNYAIFWVEVADDLGTARTIYIYYGKSDATTTSNGDNTFNFFDDFPGTSLDTTNKWDVINPGAGSYWVSGGLLTIQSTGDWWGTTDTSLYVVSKSSFSFNYAAESLINQIGSDTLPRFFGLRASSVANSRMFVMIGDFNRSHITNVYRDSDGGNAGWYGEDSGISNPGNNKIARFERNGDTVTSYYNNSLMNTRTVTNWDLVKVALTDTIAFGAPPYPNKFDWIFVRKYVDPQPSHGTWGSEEGEEGLYTSPGTIASQVLDTGINGDRWDALFWDETLPAGTDITFEVRASDTLNGGFPDASWVPVGGTSPVLSGLPSGRYMQWRATLATSDTSETPTLHEVRVYYY